MADTDGDSMATTRALLTDYRRAVLAGRTDDLDSDVSEDRANQREYEEVSRVRNIIEDELTTDADILHRHQPDLYGDLVDAVVSPAGLETLREERPEVIQFLKTELCEESADVPDQS